jgi:hypothetical protein
MSEFVKCLTKRVYNYMHLVNSQFYPPMSENKPMVSIAKSDAAEREIKKTSGTDIYIYIYRERQRILRVERERERDRR